MNLESRGIPAGFIASFEFTQAAEAQGKSLGIHPKSVFVPHPIQDRTDDEMRELAKNSIKQVLQLVIEDK